MITHIYHKGARSVYIYTVATQKDKLKDKFIAKYI